MTLYVFKCSAGNEELEHFYPLGGCPDEVTCPEHDSPARRIVARGTFSRVPGGYASTTR